MHLPALLTPAFRRKCTTPQPASYASTSSDITTPVRSLTLFDLILLGIGATLGSGLFILTGYAARFIAGPAVSISFVIAGAVCLFSALSFAEMSSRLPNCGGPYSFAYAALGELPAFLVAMCLTLANCIGSAAIARSLGTYIGDCIPALPHWVTGSHSTFSVLGLLFVAASVALLSLGLHKAKWVINGGTLLYGGAVLTIIAFGSSRIQLDNWASFMPFGLQGVLGGASSVFFAYLGFEELVVVSEETLNPSKDVPLAMLVTLFAVTSMYVMCSLVLTGIVPYTLIDAHAPFSAAMRSIGLPVVSGLVGLGTILGLSNTGLLAMTAQPRLMLSMGRDSLIPHTWVSNFNATNFWCGVVVAALAFVFDTRELVDIVSGASLLTFLTTNWSVLLLRCRLGPPEKLWRTSRMVLLFMACGTVTAICVRFVGTTGNYLSVGLLVLSLSVMGFCAGYLMVCCDFPGGHGVEVLPPSFLCPWVPGLPLAGSFSTLFLTFQLPSESLCILFMALFATTLFYFMVVSKDSLARHDYKEITGNVPGVG